MPPLGECTRVWHVPRVKPGDTRELDVDVMAPGGEGVALDGGADNPDGADGADGAGGPGGPDGPDVQGGAGGPGGADVQGGVAVHVPGAFPGERVGVRISHVSRHQPQPGRPGRAHAELREVLRPAPGRRPSPCVHHDTGLPPARRQAPRCTGCPLLSLAVTEQRALKQAQLLRDHGLAVDRVVAGPEEFGYRWSSKRVVGGAPGQLVLGSYVRGSHTLAAMHACQVDHPQIVLAAEELRRIADALGIVPYDEKTGAGDLRYAWFKTDGSDVLLTLVTASEDSRAAAELPERLRRPVGVAWSVQPGPGNNLRGQPPRLLRGAGELTLALADVPTTTGPLGFLQPNPPTAALAYVDLVRGVAGEPLSGALAFDLYAGAGVTTRLLHAHFAEVRACEAYPESAAQLGVPPETAEAFLTRQLAAAITTPALVIANPPREGLGPQVCAALLRLAAPRLHVMSCGPAGLARDLAALTSPAVDGGAYRLAGVRAYDTLPHTPHIELVAWLER